MNFFLSPVYLVFDGPFKTLLACCLSSNNEDKQRANTASPIKVTGIP
jgi:hypothetical protein